MTVPSDSPPIPSPFISGLPIKPPFLNKPQLRCRIYDPLITERGIRYVATKAAQRTATNSAGVNAGTRFVRELFPVFVSKADYASLSDRR
jgi:hypothetical protein